MAVIHETIGSVSENGVKMKPIYVTSEEASIIMVMLNETDILLEKAKKSCYPLTEDQLLKIADKARKVCWEFHCDLQKQREKK